MRCSRMSGNEEKSSYDTKRIINRKVQQFLPATSAIGSLQGAELITTVSPDASEHATHQFRKDQISDKSDDVLGNSVVVRNLLKAVRKGNHERFSFLLKQCGPLRLGAPDVSNVEDKSHSLRLNARHTIANAIVEELMSSSIDCSAFVQTLIDTNLDLRGSHETINGRRLWFWAALKDHADLITYMLNAGFPIDQGLSSPDQSTLALALPPNSDSLPNGITALFSALITNSYCVASQLIKHGSALKLH